MLIKNRGFIGEKRKKQKHKKISSKINFKPKLHIPKPLKANNKLIRPLATTEIRLYLTNFLKAIFFENMLFEHMNNCKR